jgi:hypothetical protein
LKVITEVCFIEDESSFDRLNGWWMKDRQ